MEPEKLDIEQIVRENLKPVYSFIYHLTGGHEDSADITQEVFIKVWKNLARRRPEGNFKAWLFRIARNAFIDWYRKKKPVRLEPEQELNLPDDAPLSDDLFARAENEEQIDEALAQIPPDYQAVVLLRHDEDLTFAEIAEVLGKPLNTVKSQYRRALHQIRNLLRL